MGPENSRNAPQAVWKFSGAFLEFFGASWRAKVGPKKLQVGSKKRPRDFKLSPPSFGFHAFGLLGMFATVVARTFKVILQKLMVGVRRLRLNNLLTVSIRSHMLVPHMSRSCPRQHCRLTALSSARYGDDNSCSRLRWTGNRAPALAGKLSGLAALPSACSAALPGRFNNTTSAWDSSEQVRLAAQPSACSAKLTNRGAALLAAQQLECPGFS